MDFPESMTALGISAPGGPEVLKPEQRPVPSPGDGEILIRVSAAGVNRPDVLQRSGAYPPPKGASDILGLEVAGRVAAVGAGVTRWKPGDAVCALTPGGGYAEYVLVDGTNTLPIPAGVSDVQAAAIPETFFTVWHNVFDRAGLQPGETLLLHGGASGIGTTATMLAKAFGATVAVTAGSDEKCAACRELGADIAINYRDEDWVSAIKEATAGRGADVILDIVGGPYLQKNYQAAAVGGRIVSIAFLQGSRGDVDFMRLMMKRLTHTGSTLRAQSVEVKAGIASQLEDRVWPLLEKAECLPLIHARFPLAEASRAHELMESNAHIGKIVLEIGAV
ncbi:NAD(P)H-quinone oxidoreductase [Paracoccus saliphilus]|uniref:NAD(P)H quinone oxidoreductase, PIG3 family n=1 Tax=Paracoccus saliphilus TaxID=405559 RepID=A0AA46A6Y3_9RHOB|nr:NAD(P)H-quinone oxidoreductase [Paracoccus saliphilus]WCR03799.1 NAD(P)H-quinone oxidoreductase [Paracoccus saliphilus]SIT04789.1 putative NAD(P)H quinone oxidoreductase, PIG3 family [Paracoccus saliphilus]